MIDSGFWKGKRVFITGHTGFKGSWLSLWLSRMGAKVYGYSLPPPTKPSMYELCLIDKLVHSTVADIRDLGALKSALGAAAPDFIIHMAAQPIVRDSYKDPVGTYSTNVMGTVNILEAARGSESARGVVVVTSDKCYENREVIWGYREHDRLGGRDPYSNSKACAEHVTAAYRASFFDSGKVGIASARAGNVIGGGDWAMDRLLPDCVRAVIKNETVVLRNPNSIRPWQHVLEPLAGYLLLCQKLYGDRHAFAGEWNFGPADESVKTVEWVVKKFLEGWPEGAGYSIDSGAGQPHEAICLSLDCSKSKAFLGWRPVWNIDKAIGMVVEWTRSYIRQESIQKASIEQIEEFTAELDRVVGI
jgi:CDP-glucose 4,6-dehydratase